MNTPRKSNTINWIIFGLILFITSMMLFGWAMLKPTEVSSEVIDDCIVFDDAPQVTDNIQYEDDVHRAICESLAGNAVIHKKPNEYVFYIDNRVDNYVREVYLDYKNEYKELRIPRKLTRKTKIARRIPAIFTPPPPLTSPETD